jgi:hypothetical protein
MIISQDGCKIIYYSKEIRAKVFDTKIFFDVPVTKTGESNN